MSDIDRLRRPETEFRQAAAPATEVPVADDKGVAPWRERDADDQTTLRTRDSATTGRVINPEG